MDTAQLQRLIESFLQNLGVSYTRIDLTHEDGQAVFVIRSSDSGLLIGQNGENLRALNTLMRRIAERRLGEFPPEAFLLDVNGYYTRKIREIKQQATLLADRARLFKSSVEMNPMNAYERMVVHALFSNNPEISTESQGEGRLRHIVISYKGPERDALSSDTSLLAN